MDDLFHLQLLQQQQQQQQSQKMIPPMGRRSSLLACMDEEGKIDPVRYIQHSKMKRANFLYHMNNLFPGSTAALPSRNSSAIMNRMMMSSMMNNNSGNSNSMLNGGMMNGLADIRRSSLPMSLPTTRRGSMDFSRTGVVPPRMFGSLGLGNDLERIMHGNNSRIVSGASSLSTSPALKPTPAMMAAAASTMGRSQQPQGVLNQDEYDAAEALLFGIGRACPSNKNAEGRNDEETTTKSTTGKKNKTTPKKAATPKKRKTKALPTKKKTPKKKATNVAGEGDDEARSQPPLKKRNKILELYPECFN